MRQVAAAAAGILAAVVGLACLAALPASAGVVGTAHEIGAESGGVCAVCHLPHKAAGDKLWPTDMSGANRYGGIGALCYYCHGPGDAGGSGIVSSNLGNVWHEHSHGLNAARSPDGAAAVDATLPYVAAAGAGTFECTTCHNVHDDAYRPFLWDTIDRLCLRCHPRRNFVGGAPAADVGEWGAFSGEKNPGTHPVGTDVFGTRRDSAPIDPALAGLGLLPWDGGLPGTHNLGPHLIGGGAPGAKAGIGCNTCHAVHGTYPEGGAETPPGEDLLAIAQGSSASGHANGEGGTASALCESCHRGPRPQGYAGAAWPNPGSLSFTHPVDDYDSSRDKGVTELPAGWPAGSNPTAVMRPNLICGSCHLAHPLAAFVAQPEAPPRGDGVGTPLLRDEITAICADCHKAGFGAHHPVGPGLMGSGRFRDSFIGNQDDDLTCEDCHLPGGAHNWPVQGLPGLDPDWRPKDSSLAPGQPSDNGRIGELKGVRFTEQRSLECFRCHTNSGERFTPTRGKAGGRRINAQYQALGDGSHFLGKTKPEGVKTGLWPRGGYSRYAGTPEEPVLVCESCHDLKPTGIAPGSPQLLETHADGEIVDTNVFCTACHVKGVMKGGNHPMTGELVSFAVDSGRTLQTLKTGGGEFRIPENPDGTGANTPGAPTGPATYPRENAMTCDSCHQTHDASGSTLILEVWPAAIKPVGILPTTTLYGEWQVPDADGTSFDYQALCVQCHTK